MAAQLKHWTNICLIAVTMICMSGPLNALSVGIIDYTTGDFVLATNDDNKPPDDPNNLYEDQDARVGALRLKTQTVGGYTISGLTAFSDPFLSGNTQQVLLSVGSIVSTSAPSSSIGIVFTANDLTWPPSNPTGTQSANLTQFAFSGFTQGFAQARAWIDPTNSFFLDTPLTTTPIGTITSGSPAGGSPVNSFSSQTSASLVFDNSQSFRIYGLIDVTHTRPGQVTALNAVVTVVPVPASAPLLLAALMGLAGLVSFCRSSAQTCLGAQMLPVRGRLRLGAE